MTEQLLNTGPYNFRGTHTVRPGDRVIVTKVMGDTDPALEAGFEHPSTLDAVFMGSHRLAEARGKLSKVAIADIVIFFPKELTGNDEDRLVTIPDTHCMWTLPELFESELGMQLNAQ